MKLAVLAQRPYQDRPRDIPIVPYCPLPHDASATKAARRLHNQKNAARALKGGIYGWDDVEFSLEVSKEL